MKKLILPVALPRLNFNPAGLWCHDRLQGVRKRTSFEPERAGNQAEENRIHDRG